MSWWRRLFGRKAAPRQIALIPPWLPVSFSPFTFRRLVEEGYRINAAVFACVTALAFSFPEPPLRVGYEEDGRFLANPAHPLQRLIRRPNPDMGEAEFLQMLVVYAAIGGNAYIWKQRSPAGQVVALWPFSDAQMHPVPGRNTEQGFVSHYEYEVGDGRRIRIPKRDVIHWKWMPDPLRPWRGMGAIEAAAREVDRDNEAVRYIYALLRNDAVPKVVVTLTEGDELTEAKAYRLRQQWFDRLGGDRRGGVAFLEYGMDVKQLGFDLNQLAAEALSSVPEARIAAAFRVPPVVAGLSVGLKRSDYGDRAARRSFTEQTLTALWRSLASEMEQSLQDDFGDEFVLRFDLSQVMALREEESRIWEQALNAFDRGMITRAEAKRMVGLEPKPEDNVYKLTLAAEFAPAPSRESGQKGSGWNAKRATQYGKQAKRKLRMRFVRMTAPKIEDFFTSLAGKVVKRLREALEKKAAGDVWQGIDVEELLQGLIGPEDFEALKGVLQGASLAMLEETWRILNEELHERLDLDEGLLQPLWDMLAKDVREIESTTRKAIQELVQKAYREGWSIEDLVRGRDEEPGLRDVVKEVYRGRAETIARTELGRLQNEITVMRYRKAGVGLVEILDNGQDDDDAPCQQANGQIWTLAYFAAHPLEHPNCTRAAVPYFGERSPDRG